MFAQVNELRKWRAWSPWAKKDPNAKETFDGPAAGTGAAMSWAGNNDVGEGRMTIVESRPAEVVRFKLEFFKPFAATNSAEFAFREEGGRTAVTWTMRGQNNFVGKAMCLVFDMDKMVGGDFEQGLAGIRRIVESKSSSEEASCRSSRICSLKAAATRRSRSTRRALGAKVEMLMRYQENPSPSTNPPGAAEKVMHCERSASAIRC